jgi:hypothetical protein
MEQALTGHTVQVVRRHIVPDDVIVRHDAARSPDRR